MKKPEELIELLSALADEVRSSSAMADEGASMTFFLRSDSFNLTGDEAVLVLHNAETVSRLFEALGSPSGMDVEIKGIAIDEDVRQALDDRFSNVDEE